MLFPISPIKHQYIYYTPPKIKEEMLYININKYINTKYLYGGLSLNGIDCSGLTYLIYKDNNINIPRSSICQSKKGNLIKFYNIKIGDLLFFGQSNISHTAIYIGNNKILHAISKGVTIDSIGSRVWNNYWKPRFKFIKRYKKLNI